MLSTQPSDVVKQDNFYVSIPNEVVLSLCVCWELALGTSRSVNRRTVGRLKASPVFGIPPIMDPQWPDREANSVPRNAMLQAAMGITCQHQITKERCVTENKRPDGRLYDPLLEVAEETSMVSPGRIRLRMM